MKRRSFMVIAGEPSGDHLAADLVRAIGDELAAAPAEDATDYQPLRTSLAPVFFGAGGPRMREAGVNVAVDLTAHSVIGLWDVLRKFFDFRRLFHRLLRLALEEQPDTIICVDYSGFNRRFAHAVRKWQRARGSPFNNWHPRIVQYVSPQVWASRKGRAFQMAWDFDLVLCLFPFEKEWYAANTPGLRAVFVGHPLIDHYRRHFEAPVRQPADSSRQKVVLLPGSRKKEWARHWPPLSGAWAILRRTCPSLEATLVLPNEELAELAAKTSLPSGLKFQIGGLADALTHADAALASTGTVTMECALFGVPTVAFYVASWADYQIGKRIVKVPFLAMPNLLANEELFPEFIQREVTPENLAKAALGLLQDRARRERIQTKLRETLASLGGPGANRRAAKAILAH